MEPADTQAFADGATDAALAAIVESSSDAIVGKTVDGVITSWNRAAERIYGFSTDEALGQSIDIIVPGPQRSELAAILKRLRRGERVEQFETKRQRKDGTVIDVRLTVSPILDQSGCIRGASAVSHNITIEKDASSQVTQEEFFRTAFDDAPVPMLLVAPDGSFLRVNRLAAAFLGYERHELEGVSAHDITHPDDRDQLVEYRRNLAAGATDDFFQEKRYIRKDGTLVWAGVHGAPVFDETAALAYFVSHLQDLTGQRRAEQTLSERERELEAIFNSALDAILIVDDDRRLVNVNPAAEKLLGLPGEEILGKRLDDFLAVEATKVDGMWAAFITGGSLEATRPLRAADGSTRIVDMTAVANVLPGQHLAIQRDVTEKHRAAEQLRLSEETLRSLTSQLPVVLWKVDQDLTITAASGSLLERVKAPERASPIGLNLAEYNANDPLVEETLRRHRRALAGEPVSYERQVQGRTVEIHLAPFRNPDGLIVGVLGVGLDITDRIQLEDELRQAQRMEAVGQLAGGVAHDFNNLLLVINGYADLARVNAGADTELRRQLEEILSAGSRAAELTQQLLAFSRRQILQPRVLDLNEVASDAGKLLRRLIGEDIQIVTSLGADLGSMLGDPGQLGQVLINLAVNARDAMPDGGTLTIETSNVELDEHAARALWGATPGSYVLLAVSDTGRGMDPLTKAHIFEPFYTTKPVGQGTGLGLSTVYGIVKQSGGHISVHSEPDEGATFRLYFPRTEAAEAETKSRQLRVPRTGFEHILLVEDEDLVRDLIVEMLEQQGYRVTSVGDPVAALELGGTDYDLLITDLVMPKMNGRELVDGLRASRADLKVLFMSGYTNTAIVERGVLDSELNFLQKPFTLADIADKIRDVLDSD